MAGLKTRVIAISWTPLWPLRGGAAIRSFALLSRLVEFDIRVVAPGPLPPGFRGTSVPRRAERFLPFNPDVLQALLPFLGSTARRLADEEPPDVVIACGIWSMRAARSAARGVPIVLDLAHVESDTARETRSHDPLRIPLAWAERRAFAQASRIWTVSSEDRERVGRLSPESLPKVSVVPNGIDGLEPPAPKDGSPFRVLFVGRMSFRPNRKAAQFLADRIAPLFPGGRILIAGESPPAGLTGVDVLGFVPELSGLYAQAHVACAPVFLGSGVRNKVLEAARFSVPLVATARAVEGYDFIPGVHYFRAESAREFAEAFERLRCDETLRAELASRARIHVGERFLWQTSAEAAGREILALSGQSRSNPQNAPA